MNRTSIAVACGAALFWCGCEVLNNSGTASGAAGDRGGTVVSRTSGSMAEAESRADAVARLNPTEGNDVRGAVAFLKESGGLRVVAQVTGLTPGKHGFHIHEKGDCSAPDASSAGDHFNPTGAPHGAPHSPQHHAGDFGNIVANAQGIARYDALLPWLKLEGEQSIIGKAVIVHAGEDDLRSQPSGEAGGRVACGVIQKR